MVGLADLKKLLSERKKIEGICYHLIRLYETKGEGAFSCENKKSNWWCCDDHYERMPYRKAVNTLIEHAKSVIKDVEEQSDNVIEEFTVGKTHVDINLTSDYFSPEQPSTWDENYVAINKRWKDYEDSGYHCLIVMCCITKDITERRINKKNKRFPMNQEQYALAMEQRLIHYFRLTKPDSRLGNKSFATGKEQEEPMRGGIVYVAFKFKEDETNGSQTSDKLPNDTSSSGLQNIRTAKTEGQDKKRKKKPKKVYKSKSTCSVDSSSSEGEKETSNVSEMDQVSVNELSMKEVSVKSGEEEKDEAWTEQNLLNDSEGDDGRIQEPTNKRKRNVSPLSLVTSDPMPSSIAITTVPTSDLLSVEQSMSYSPVTPISSFTNTFCTSVSSTITTGYKPMPSCPSEVCSTVFCSMDGRSINSTEFPNSDTLQHTVQRSGTQEDPSLRVPGFGLSYTSATPASYLDTAAGGTVPGLTNEDQVTLTYMNSCAEQKAILNVGGNYFHTSIPTLKAVPDSLFCKILHTDSPFKRKLSIFIDRDSKHFDIILNYLRGGGKMNTLILLLDLRQLYELRSEAEFYQLHDLVRIIDYRLSAYFPPEAGLNETLS